MAIAKKPRRQKITSAASISRVMAAASKEIRPPEYMDLDDTDMKFFRSIIKEAPNADWTDHKIEVAAVLAKTLAQWEAETNTLRDEGSVYENERGQKMVNPRKDIVKMHAANISTLRRSLSIHGRGQGGELRDVAKRKAYGRNAQAMAQSIDDDLIALPGVH